MKVVTLPKLNGSQVFLTHSPVTSLQMTISLLLAFLQHEKYLKLYLHFTFSSSFINVKQLLCVPQKEHIILGGNSK